jgi:hypothetical protein
MSMDLERLEYLARQGDVEARRAYAREMLRRGSQDYIGWLPDSERDDALWSAISRGSSWIIVLPRFGQGICFDDGTLSLIDIDWQTLGRWGLVLADSWVGPPLSFDLSERLRQRLITRFVGGSVYALLAEERPISSICHQFLAMISRRGDAGRSHDRLWLESIDRDLMPAIRAIVRCGLGKRVPREDCGWLEPWMAMTARRPDQEAQAVAELARQHPDMTAGELHRRLVETIWRTG